MGGTLILGKESTGSVPDDYSIYAVYIIYRSVRNGGIQDRQVTNVSAETKWNRGKVSEKIDENVANIMKK